MLKAFNQKCQNLTRFPNLGKRYPQMRDNLRRVPLDGYIIFYRVHGEDGEVLRVVSGRQDLEALFGEEE